MEAERVRSERNIYREKRKGRLLFSRTLSAAVEYIQTQAHKRKLYVDAFSNKRARRYS